MAKAPNICDYCRSCFRRSPFRPSAAAITTVTRSIVVIGFDQVKLVALGMLFVDQMPDQERATALKRELIQSLQASLLAKEMSRQIAPADVEKAVISPEDIRLLRTMRDEIALAVKTIR